MLQRSANVLTWLCVNTNKFLIVFTVCVHNHHEIGYLDSILTLYADLEPSSASANVRSRVSCSIMVLCAFCEACMPCVNRSITAQCVRLSQYCTSFCSGYSSRMVYMVSRLPSRGWSRVLCRVARGYTVCITACVIWSVDPAKSVFY